MVHLCTSQKRRIELTKGILQLDKSDVNSDRKRLSDQPITIPLKRATKVPKYLSEYDFPSKQREIHSQDMAEIDQNLFSGATIKDEICHDSSSALQEDQNYHGKSVAGKNKSGNRIKICVLIAR